jgi:hypothetical protein
MLTPKHTIWDESQMPYKGNLFLLQTNFPAIKFRLFNIFLEKSCFNLASFNDWGTKIRVYVSCNEIQNSVFGGLICQIEK